MLLDFNTKIKNSSEDLEVSLVIKGLIDGLFGQQQMFFRFYVKNLFKFIFVNI